MHLNMFTTSCRHSDELVSERCRLNALAHVAITRVLDARQGPFVQRSDSIYVLIKTSTVHQQPRCRHGVRDGVDPRTTPTLPYRHEKKQVANGPPTYGPVNLGTSGEDDAGTPTDATPPTGLAANAARAFSRPSLCSPPIHVIHVIHPTGLDVSDNLGMMGWHVFIAQEWMPAC